MRPPLPVEDGHYRLDLDVVERNFRALAAVFPGTILYAMKANPVPPILGRLASAGLPGFDVASVGEMALAQQHAPGKALWYMNPVKSERDLRRAYHEHGARAFVVDSLDELEKMLGCLPADDSAVQLFIRFRVEHSSAVFDLNWKFGATVEETVAIAKRLGAASAWRLGLAFHVGSQTTKVAPYERALQTVTSLLREHRLPVRALDIGGGFPGAYENFEHTPAASLLASVMTLLRGNPLLAGLELICEPGRSLVFDAMSMFSPVLLRKGDRLHLENGVFNGLFSVFAWLQFPIRCWRGDTLLTGETRGFELYGPTCDSLDKHKFTYPLPSALRRGDVLEFAHVGAYCWPLNTVFNGFPRPAVYSPTGELLVP